MGSSPSDVGTTFAEVCNLQMTYGCACDFRDVDRLEQLFSADATWERIASAENNPRRFVGRLEIIAGFRSMYGLSAGSRPVLRASMYVFSNPLVRYEPSAASARWNFQVIRLDAQPGSSPIKTVGEYAVRYEQRKDRWHITSMRCTPLWTAAIGRLNEACEIPSSA